MNIVMRVLGVDDALVQLEQSISREPVILRNSICAEREITGVYIDKEGSPCSREARSTFRNGIFVSIATELRVARLFGGGILFSLDEVI